MKPSIFIGSSKEGESTAQKVKDFFSADYDVTLWSDDVFKYNESFLETLLKAANLFDFAFMIFSKDDFSDIRGKLWETPRDNVLFEYGLFLGTVGRNRAFILQEKNVKLPTDLLGITIATYTIDKNNNIVNYEEILSKIKKQIDEKVLLGELGLLPSTVIALSYFDNFISLVAEQIVAAKGCFAIGQNTYSTVKMRIVVPGDLDHDIKKRATVYYSNRALKDEQLSTTHRTYPIHVKVGDNNQDTLIIEDMPTILNGVDKAIEMIFRGSYVGKKPEQQLAEQRELSNFVRVMKILIEGDAYCKHCVEIVDEEGHRL